MFAATRRSVVSVALFAGLAAAPSAYAQSFQPLGVLEAGGRSSASGISADGQTVIGEASFNDVWHRAYRWTSTTGMVNIDPAAPQYDSSYALGVSANGGIVTGYRRIRTLTASRSDGPPRPGWPCFATCRAVSAGAPGGVSEDGQITAGEGAETFTGGGGLPARWTVAGDVSQLPVFNDTYSGEALSVSADGHVIVGFADHFIEEPSAYTVEACRWVNGALLGLGDLPGAQTPIARAVHASSDGSVICGHGYDDEADPVVFHGFRWTAATGITLLPDVANSDQNIAQSISDNGSIIVGEYHTGDVFAGEWHAAVWIDGQASDLSQTLTTSFGVDLQGWTLDRATGISADGTAIVGTGHLGTAPAQGWIVRLGSAIWSPPGACYANCDASVSTPRLNVLDFTCFLQKFASGNTYANCDQSVTAPTLNVLDFSCFLQKFAQGCP